MQKALLVAGLARIGCRMPNGSALEMLFDNAVMSKRFGGFYFGQLLTRMNNYT